ncbi:MAG TPA: LamG-like jellyroll fold domain-containing protein [Bdellovibrionota bacterium]|jgi:hypothetical protein|nr:LamG-like jellyroll fold domain-containing protein [Bdellovibrionota bacterium]
MKLRFLWILFAALLGACNPLSDTKIGRAYFAGVDISLSNSTLSLSATAVPVGGTVDITLALKDDSGMPYASELPEVTFTAVGGTSLGTIGSVTNRGNGIYTAVYTATNPGTAQTIVATVDGKALTSTAPTVLVINGTFSLSNSVVTVSSGTVTSGSPVTVTLTVKDSSNSQLSSGGETVTFARSGGTSSGTFSAVTDHNDGTYSATFTGTTAGTATSITATIATLAVTSTPPTVTVSAGTEASVAVSSGNSQSATAGSAVTNPLIAVVKDANNNVKSGVTVSWAVTAGGGSLSSCTTTTSASGLVQCSLTTGTTAGTNTVTASVAGIATPATFTATGTVGAASSIAVSSGDSQSATAGAALTNPLIAVVKDANNNVKSGVTVSWAVTAGGGSLSSCTTTTSASGLVQCSLTTGTTAGTNTVTASVAGIATPATFGATGNVGVATKLVFATQPSSTASGSAITAAVTVKAQDANSNDVSSYASNVTVAISTNPASGTLSGTLTQAPSSGVATFGDLSIDYSGTGYRITASDGALTSAVSSLFNITAIAVTKDWPFTALTTGDYTSSDWAKMDFSGGVCRLTASLQTDSEATETSANAITSGIEVGVVYGTLADGVTQGLKLGSDGGCNGATTDCAKQTASEIYELNTSWTPQWASLVNYWKFNNDWNDSKGTNHATAGGSATFSTSSKLGSHAGIFNGTSSYLSTPNAGLNPNTTALTAMAWVYLDATGGGEKKIIQQLDGTGAGRVWISYSGATFMSYLGANWTYSTTIPAAGTWYHLAMTSTGGGTSTVSIYVNGKFEASQVLNAEASTGSYAIGAHKTYAANFFPGKLDDVAIWSTALSAAEIATIYDRQRPAYSGTFTSRVMDGKSSSSWTKLSWVPPLPFLKSLPDGGSSESSTNYTSQGDNLMSGIVGLWHLDEAAGTSGAGSVIDKSGQATPNNGTPTGITFGNPGKFSSAALFDGTSSQLSIPTTSGMGSLTAMTLSAWVRPNIVDASQDIIIDGGGDVRFRLSVNNGLFNNGFGDGTGWNQGGLASTTVATVGNWYHVVSTIDENYVRMYVNGVKEAESATGSARSIGVPVWPTIIGGYSGGGYKFSGTMDEVAIWSRALSTPEVLKLYRRGANRVKYQVRSCSDNTCTTGSPAWKGPDNTSGTFFSELYNTTSNSLTGTVQAGLPEMLYSNFGSLSVADNRYFQYRAILESENATYVPELKSTTVDPPHYDTSSPSIYGNNSVTFSTLNAFTETQGANACTNGSGCTASLGYNLSLDKSTWKYWNGSNWVTANGTATQSNSEAVVQANLGTFDNDVGKGSVYVKAYLKSSGTCPCEIDNLHLGGNR